MESTRVSKKGNDKRNTRMQEEEKEEEEERKEKGKGIEEGN